MSQFFTGLVIGTAVAVLQVDASVLVVAHRGNSGSAPENTLAAVDAAAGVADLVEVDVRVSQDGTLLLMHDATLDRTTDGTGSVSSQNYAGGIDGLDAGSWFGPAFTGEPVPTMVAAIDRIMLHGMTPMIERKAGTAVAYHSALQTQGVLDDVVIISFDWTFLSNLRALDADIVLGALGSGAIDASVVSAVQAAGADYMSWHHNAIDAAALALVHGAGMELHAYTVNNPSRMQELMDLGVDGITTDHPQVLTALIPEPAVGLYLVAGMMIAAGRRRRLG